MPLVHDIAEDVKGDIKAVRQMRLRLPWWGMLCVIAGSALVGWWFLGVGRFNLATPTLNSVIVIICAIAVKWQLRRCAWFWTTIVLLGALHVPLILFVPWSTKWIPAPAIAAVDLADLIVMLVILDAVARVMKGPSHHKNHQANGGKERTA
jgi:hypothetical protein